MSPFEWKDEFRTGNVEMDKHHMKFFDYLKELEDAIGSNKGKDYIDLVIRQTENYIKYHFTEEEKLLKSTGNPSYESQRKQHEFFAAQIAELKEKYSKGDQTIPASMSTFLRDWLLHHILESDKKYGSLPQEGKR